MEVDIQSAVSGSPPAGRVRRLVRRIGHLVPPPASRLPAHAPEVSVLFCGDARMRTLNRRYRGADRSTDVLAFPGKDPALGDIVICLPYARREARRREGGPAREIDRLLLHGYLHLLGYDHEADHGEMDALESRLRRRLGIGS